MNKTILGVLFVSAGVLTLNARNNMESRDADTSLAPNS